MNAQRRKRIFENYGGKCHICGSPIVGEQFDVDHMRPRNLGGDGSVANLAPAHVRCNRSKQDSVSHVDPGKQFVLSSDFANRKIEKSAVDFDPSAARSWILGQIAAGKTDSGLAQRFHVWLRQQSGGEIGFPESTRLFLFACKDEHIHARDIDGHFIYGIYPAGIAPQPQQPAYRGDNGKMH